MDDPQHHGSLEPDGMPYTAMPAMPATTQGLAYGGSQLITDMVRKFCQNWWSCHHKYVRPLAIAEQVVEFLFPQCGETVPWH